MRRLWLLSSGYMKRIKKYTKIVERLKIYKGGRVMTIYEELIRRVSDGETFNIDFKNQTIKVGKAYLIKNGEYDKKKFSWAPVSIDDVLNTIDRLYHEYKYSLPSERNDNKRKKYFKALPIDELTDIQLITAKNREVAQASLEGFILCSILYGNLVWDEDKMGKWFWQSEIDPDLVILRSWIENK